MTATIWLRKHWHSASKELNSASQIMCSFIPTKHRSLASLLCTPESGVLAIDRSSFHFQGFFVLGLLFLPYWRRTLWFN